MTVLAFVSSVLALPPLEGYVALTAMTLLVLASLALATLAALAWQSLGRHATWAKEAADRLERGSADVPAAFVARRAQLAAAAASVERALWALPGFDGQIAAARQQLARQRAALDQWRPGSAQARTAARVRRTIRLVRQALTLRRTFAR